MQKTQQYIVQAYCISYAKYAVFDTKARRLLADSKGQTVLFSHEAAHQKAQQLNKK